MTTTRRTISVSKRFEVFRRDNFKCQYCGRSPATEANVILHVDHRMPFSRGGSDEASNLVTACAACNLGKSDTYVPHVPNWNAEAERVCLLLEDASSVAFYERWYGHEASIEDAYIDTYTRDEYTMPHDDFLMLIDDGGEL